MLINRGRGYKSVMHTVAPPRNARTLIQWNPTPAARTHVLGLQGERWA
jgi:hypothetical protein